jgi:hypothetical protein
MIVDIRHDCCSSRNGLWPSMEFPVQ